MGALHAFFFRSEGFMPHGHCYLWTPGLLWTNVISDSLIALAYFAIPFTLIYFVRHRRDIPFNWMFLAFGIFILACGATHVMDVWTTWRPNYWLAGVIKGLTAAASVPTAVLLAHLVPQALAIPSPQQLMMVNERLLNEIDERKRVEEQLRQEKQHSRFSEARLSAFVNNNPSNIAIKDLDGRYLLVNRQFARSYGLEPHDVLGRTPAEIFPAEQAAQYLASDFDVLRTGAAIEVEETAQYTDGLHTNIVCKFPLFDADMRVVAIGAIATDITDRKRAEQDLARSQALLNEAQKLSHLGSWQWNLIDKQMIWSEELYRILGLHPDRCKASYENMVVLVNPDQRATVERTIQAAVRTGRAFTMECRIERPNGGMRDLRSVGEVVKDAQGGASALVVSVLDITDQKGTESELREYAEQLQALSRQLVEVQESERKRLTRELHDRVGQNLTALSINLDILKTQLSREHPAELHSRLEDSISLVESTADTIDNVMAELRPPMLDDHGLLPALHWYAKEFSQRTGIDVLVSGEELKEGPAQEVEITLFRITQEALNNVAKHAHATHVVIELELSGGQCILSVSDDGMGFTPAPSLKTMSRSGRGLVNMRERAQAVAGRFEVRAAPGEGTQITIRVPC